MLVAEKHLVNLVKSPQEIQHIVQLLLLPVRLQISAVAWMAKTIHSVISFMWFVPLCFTHVASILRSLSNVSTIGQAN